MTSVKQSFVSSLAAYLDKWLSPPIFILAPPRSGSTFLFECLRRAENVLAPQQESDHVWWRLFPYRPPDFNDFVSAEKATPENIHALRRQLLASALRVNFSGHLLAWHTLTSLLAHPHRYRLLDKTIANCFHLEFLQRAYPTGRYIFLVRDPRATISSMIEGWEHVEMMGKPQLDALIPPGSRITHWNYPAPPGWQEQTTRPLVEICAWSWRQHIEYALSFVETHPEATVWLRYEDLFTEPLKVIQKASAQLDLRLSSVALEYATRRPFSRTTISAPSKEKWRRIHKDEIEHVLPTIRPLAARIGYEI
ncbi:MAG: sulfotransferase [Anaerolineae bacterium]|nr:MAG: sulfotransferase [Anaerolineae bacterium]